MTSKAPLYGLSFNEYDPNGDAIFAIVGGLKIIIIKLSQTLSSENCPGDGVNILQVYEDENDQENFYCCTWSYDLTTGLPLLAVAGASGLIKVIDTSKKSLVKVLAGHGDEINELKFHPLSPCLLLSASKDFSIRLWNIKTERVIAVFGGECGHREPVLSIDFHLSGDYFASAAMDHSAKIWSLCSPLLKNAIQASFTSQTQPSTSTLTSLPVRCQKRLHHIQTCFCAGPNKPARLPIFVHFPLFSTIDLHNNYVDCIRWYGDMLMSRCATETRIIMWKACDVSLSPAIGHNNCDGNKNNGSNVIDNIDDDDIRAAWLGKTPVAGGPAIESKRPTKFDIICEFPFQSCDIWFIRCGVSSDHKLLAMGNQIGRIYIYDLQKAIPFYIEQYIKDKKKTAYGGNVRSQTTSKSSIVTRSNSKNVTPTSSTPNTRLSKSKRDRKSYEEEEEEAEAQEETIVNLPINSIDRNNNHSATPKSVTQKTNNKFEILSPSSKVKSQTNKNDKGKSSNTTSSNKRTDYGNQNNLGPSKRLKKLEQINQNDHMIMRMLEVNQSNTAVRQVAFSADNVWLVGISDDAKIWCWARNNTESLVSESSVGVDDFEVKEMTTMKID
ncbi:5791_t:CDS:2 [Ambispora leptoticha]|uniref:5791_t:CDS:1 n=1 Tax=Ambispora leptoticha TaxID=144679 RepID=A0A9N9EZ19_9GLOM|nr:5791_t:CDS:2 [Ambispora leptoticha]